MEEYRLWEGEDRWSNGVKEGREAEEEGDQCSQTKKSLIVGYLSENKSC